MNNTPNQQEVTSINTLTDEQIQSSLIQVSIQSVALQDAQKTLVVELIRRQHKNTPQSKPIILPKLNRVKSSEPVTEIGSFDMKGAAV